MTPETAMAQLQGALQVALIVAAPMLVAALVVGVVVGLLQAATQVSEPSIAFVAKLVALMAVLAGTGAWMLARLVQFTAALIQGIPQLVG
ncbi:flagellar biosynthetic protein FliQ [Tahibacter soli]|jgi:flagellar biosynthetic protein FliQ|uniref:Flagellar biosynthetic protein FliQ n=1 Tax=Tahibacter soli TaxID=2983605 RepID=A0A9X3YJV9_9GAMM|nr:flagellar biosynthetic protein FliQ [Tahibacter soli]MDC8012874.1 flagellar biosynthetic protein FliQ [Tahibacter soli]